MKKTFVAAFALAAALAPFGAFAAEEIAHAVSAAAVFTDRAVVTRTGTAKLEKGKNEIVFAGVPENVDLRSIRAGSRVPEGVKILGVSWERRVSRVVNDKKIAALEEKLAALNERRALLSDASDFNRKRRETLQEFERRFRRAVEENSVGGKGGENWSADAEALRAEFEKIFARAAEISEQTATLEKEIAPVRDELDALCAGTDARRSVALVVTLEAERAGEAEISVAYTTRAARWKPRYSARLDRAAGTVDFSYDGEISQNTGEDWKGVALTLSTAQPQVSALPPRARRIELSGEPAASGARRIVEREAALAEFPEPIARDAVPAVANEPSDENLALSRVREQGAVVNFEIRGAHDVPSGKAAPRVSIARATLSGVELRAEAAPRLRSGVYLRATAKNETPCPILPGALSLFHDGAFLGESSLKFVPVGGEIAFFAGTEDGLSAAYAALPPYRAAHGKLKASFSGKSVTEAAGDVYTLANLTDAPRTVRLRSQIKVSEVDDVKISLLDAPYEHVPATTPGFTLEKDTGLIFWDVSVPAHGETKILLTTQTEKK
ncbi:MAG: mucoidy inhibitor MuiA family protein [Candidatus Spyradosoma sp.]